MSKLQSTLAACALMLYVLFAMTATTDAALPPGYEDVLLCPPTHCLTRLNVPRYVGSAVSMHVCKSMNGEADRRPIAWGTRVSEAEYRLKTLLAQSYHRRSCRSLYPHPPRFPRQKRYPSKRYPRIPKYVPNRPKREFRERVTDGYTPRFAYGMKPKRFEARNAKNMAYRKKQPMASEDSLQEEFEESNDKDEQSVGWSGWAVRDSTFPRHPERYPRIPKFVPSSAVKDSSDMDEGYQSVGFAIDSKAISGAQEVSGSDGVGAAAQAAAKPPKNKAKATPSDTKTKTPATKIDKKKKDATPIKFVVWCGVGAFVILLVGGVTYRHIQRRKGREFVSIDSSSFISKHTKRRSLSQSGQIYESPHVLSVV